MTIYTRRGFTLVELLAVIAIIGILVGLTLPAVNMAREVARRAACANNMRNIALGAVNFEISNTNKGFPGYLQAFGAYNGSAATAHVKVGTWAVSLLPMVEQQAVYDFWSDNSVSILTNVSGNAIDNQIGPSSGLGYDKSRFPLLNVFVCPSDTRFDGDHANNSYVYNCGFWDSRATAESLANGVGTCKYDTSEGNGLLSAVTPVSPDFPKSKKLTLDDVKDSRSHTMLISENLMAEEWFRINASADGLLHYGVAAEDDGSTPNVDGWLPSRILTGMVWFDQTNVPATSNIRINGDMLTRLSRSFSDFPTLNAQAEYASPSSEHRDGVNAAFVDGSVKFINQRIDYEVYIQLLSTHGKKSGPSAARTYKDRLISDTEL